VGRAQLEQHLNQCVRQDSARGTEIDLNLLMELPPFIVPEESVVKGDHLWYTPERNVEKYHLPSVWKSCFYRQSREAECWNFNKNFFSI
jgi:hypothetical protein